MCPRDCLSISIVPSDKGGDSIQYRVYHCGTVRIRPVADFSEFLSRIYSPRSGVGAFFALGGKDPSVLPVKVGQELLLVLSQDELPRAVIVASGEDLRELRKAVRTVLTVLDPDDPGFFTLPLDGVTRPVDLVPELEKGGYRAFGMDPRVQKEDDPSAVLYFHDHVMRTFDSQLKGLGPKGMARRLGETLGATEGKIGSEFIPSGSAAVVPPNPGIAAGGDTPAVTLKIREPWAALGSRLLFPAAFSSGEVQIRFRPRSYAVLPKGFEIGVRMIATGVPAPLRWYRFSHQGGGGTVNGFWVLGAGEGFDENRLTAAGEVVFRSAGAAMAGAYAEGGVSGGPWKTRFAPCSEPSTFAIPVFRVRGDLDIAHTRLSLDILVPEKTPAFLAALCGFPPMESGGSRDSENADQTLGAALALDRRLAVRPGALRLDSILMGESEAGTAFAPVHEIMECMSEGDRRLFVQNFLAPRFRGGDLAALLFRGKQSAAEEGSSGASPAGGSGTGSRRFLPLRPQAFDLRAFAALLPPVARSDFAAALKEGTASSGEEDFRARNDQAIAKAVEELRRGALSLGIRGVGFLEDTFQRWVYPRLRYPLDLAIAADRPFADLSPLTERQFRLTVDRSDAKTLAWAVLGRSPGETNDRLSRLVSLCSRRKLQAIRGELERLARLLEVGSADPDQLLAERMELAGVANRVVEGDLREAERRRAVRAEEGPGTRRYR